MQTSSMDYRWFVKELLPGLPAAISGQIKLGDEVTAGTMVMIRSCSSFIASSHVFPLLIHCCAVDDINVRGMELKDVVKLIRGPERTHVHLWLLRDKRRLCVQLERHISTELSPASKTLLRQTNVMTSEQNLAHDVQQALSAHKSSAVMQGIVAAFAR